MTDYTALSNTAVGVGGLPSGATVTALRDNPLAIAEGSAGAPRISGKAMQSEARGGLDVLTVTADTTFSSELGMKRVDGTMTTPSATSVTAASYTCVAYSGTMRFTAIHHSNATGTATIEFVKNGVLVQGWTANLSAGLPATRIVDSSLVPGDTFLWRHRKVSGTTSVVVSALATSTDGYFQVVPIMKYTEA